MCRTRRFLGSLTVLALLSWLCVAPANASVFTVDRMNDTYAADARVCSDAPEDCSLRGAVLRANADATADTIILPAGQYTLTILAAAAVPDFSNQAEQSGSNGKIPEVGDLDVLHPLTVVGAGAGQTYITGGAGWDDRFFDGAAQGVSFTISGVSLGATDEGGLGGSADRGGAIRTVDMITTITDCAFRGNNGVDGGAGSFEGSAQVLTLRRSLFEGNWVSQRGGALFFETGTGAITNTTFSGNWTMGGANTGGGGVDLTTLDTPGFRIAHSTFVGNYLKDPAAIGAGIRLVNTETTTFRANLFLDNVRDPNGVNVPENCAGPATKVSEGYNILDDDTCAFAATGDQELLGGGFVAAALADNGGPTETHSLPEDSAAVDAIPAASCDDADGAPLTVDQRGFGRPAENDGATTTCDAGAVEVGCGDGQVRLDEQCDDGPGNSNVLADACRTDCTSPRCGDGVADAGEECDDGDLVGGDGCSPSCTNEGATTCGDGIPQAGEECDDGNATNTDGCTNACTLAACGDGFVQAGEECDDGTGNGTDADECRDGSEGTTPCALPTCGDGIPDAGEECDSPQGNGTSPDQCRDGTNGTTACTLPVCGDGIQDGTEECDDGASNGTDPNECRDGSLDTIPCALPTCGDGIPDTGEECDDPAGNGTNPDQCRDGSNGTTPCAFPTCGDGIPDTGEECDDPLPVGNGQNPNQCRDGNGPEDPCTKPVCGDGIRDDQPPHDEACDDGAAGSADCTPICSIPVCGDGFIHGSEECDDGDPVDEDFCTNACQFNECGDGVPFKALECQLAIAIPPQIKWVPCEQCDDGNTIDGDGCDNNCLATGFELPPADADGDGVFDAIDNCVHVSNADQANYDRDSRGDACDPDDDNDRLLDVIETGTGTLVDARDTGTDPRSGDSDGDGIGDLAELRLGSNPNIAGDTAVATKDVINCRRALQKETLKYRKQVQKNIDKCTRKSLAKNDPPYQPGFANCSLATLKAPADSKIAKAARKLEAGILKKCCGKNKLCDPADAGLDRDVPLGLMGWDAPGDAYSVPDVGNASGGLCDGVTIGRTRDVVTQIECNVDMATDMTSRVLIAGRLNEANFASSGADVEPEKSRQKCQLTIGKEALKFQQAREKVLSKCWDAKIKQKFSKFAQPAVCPDADLSTPNKSVAKLEKLRLKKTDKICKACGGGGDRDKDGLCDAVLAPVNGFPMDVADLLDLPFECPAVRVTANALNPDGRDCDALNPVDSLQKYVDCVDCLLEFAVDADALVALGTGPGGPTDGIVVPGAYLPIPTPLPLDTTPTPTRTVPPVLTPSPTPTRTPRV